MQRSGLVVLAVGGVVLAVAGSWLLAPDTGGEFGERRRRARAVPVEGPAVAEKDAVEVSAKAEAEEEARPERPVWDPALLAARARPDERGDAVWRPMVVAPPAPSYGGPSNRVGGLLPADVVGVETLVAEQDALVRACAAENVPDARGELRIVMDFVLSPVESGTLVTAVRPKFSEDPRHAALGDCVMRGLAEVRLQPSAAEVVVTWPIRL